MTHAEPMLSAKRGLSDAKREGYWIGAIVLALLLGLAGLNAAADYAADLGRQAAMDRVESEARRHVEVLQRLWSRTWTDIDYIHQTAGEAARAMLRRDAATTAELHEHLDGMLEVAAPGGAAQVQLLAPDGRRLWDTASKSGGAADEGDRAILRAFADPARDRFIGVPDLQTPPDEWIVRFATAHRDAQQRLLAVTVVSFQSQGLRRLFGSLSRDEDELLSLWTDDGRALADSRPTLLRPDVRTRFAGRCPSDHQMFEHGASRRDGVVRAYAAACLTGSGTMVTVGLADSVWMASARDYARSIRRAAGIAAVLMVAVAAIGMRSVRQSRENRRQLRIEASLRVDQAMFHRLTDHVGNLLLKSAGPDRLVEYASPGTVNLLGCAPEQLRGRSLRDFVHPDDRALLETRAADLALGRTVGRQELRLLHADRQVVWVEIDALVDRVGESVTFYSVLRDITAQHEAGLARQAAELRLAELLERSPAGLMQLVVDADGNETDLYISPGYRATLGLPPDAVLAPGWWQSRVGAAVAAEWRAVRERLLRHGEAHFTYPMQAADGGIRWLLSSSRCERRDDGTWLVTSSEIDVTAQREAELALRVAEQRLAEVLERSPVSLFQYRLHADGTRSDDYQSPNMAAILGLPREEVGRPGWWLSHVGSSVTAQWLVQRDRLLTEGSLHWTYPIRHADGRTLRMMATYRAEPLADGGWLITGTDVDATARYEAEEARLAAEQRLEELVKRGSAVLFQYEIGPGGEETLLYLSPNAARLLGHPMQELQQSESWRRQVGPQAVERWQAMRGDLLRSGAGQWEYSYTRADGGVVQLLSTARAEPMSDGRWLLSGSLVDVTAQRAAEAQLEQARRDLQAAVDAGPGALLRVALRPDKPPVVVFASAAVERVTGFTPAEAMAEGWLTDAIDPDFRPAMDRCIVAGLAGQPCQPEMRLRARGGDWRTFQISMQPQQRDDAGGMSVVVYMTDITQQKIQDARVLHTAKLATLGEMTTSMAHELNQPLAIMSLAAENAMRDLQLEPARTESAVKRLARIHGQAVRASRLIEHLRVFGRSNESGVAPVDIAEAVAGALLLSTAKLRAHDVSVTQEIAGGLKPVRGNQVLLEQVILNLLSNACDAYEAAAATVPADRRGITIAARGAGERVILTIADRAGGIPDAILPRIFEPFFTTKAVDKGTGVGLSFCYGIVADMGGSLRAYNADGGAVLEVALPAALPTALATAPATAGPPAGQAVILEGSA